MLEARPHRLRLKGRRWGRGEPGSVAISYATEREIDRSWARRRRFARDADVR